MTTDPSGLSIGRRSTTALAVLAGLVVLALLVPSHANANARAGSSSLLRQGLGMTAKPSVRVQALQRALMRRGYSVGRYGADGRFGTRTAHAVRRFQAARHLRADGIVGPRTRAAMRGSASTTSAKAAAGAHRAPTTSAKAPAGAQRAPTTSAKAPAGAQRAPTATSPSQPASNTTNSTVQTAPKASSSDARPARVDVVSGPAWWRSPLLSGVLAALLVVAGAVVLPRYRRRAAAVKYYRANMARARMRAPALPAADLDTDTLVSLRTEQPPAARPETASQTPAVVRGPAIGYISGRADLNADQALRSERAIRRICARDGWTLLDIVHDTDEDPPLAGSAIGRTLARIAAGEARALVVSDARLLGAAIDLREVMERLDAAEAALVAIDLGLDTSTPHGRRIASALITMNGWGRQRPSRRPTHHAQDGRIADRVTPHGHAGDGTSAGRPIDTGVPTD
jgi:peptidoglycan hydrolase-like protein with peptidoglycan-binding domain